MPHNTDIPVTWGDTDAGGLIYYPRFFHYVVIGLNDYFAPAVANRHLMESLRESGYALPAVEATASFTAPLRAGDTARIELTIHGGTTSLTVTFDITRTADGRKTATGEVAFVLVDEAFEATPLPDAIHDCIRDRGDEEPGNE